MLGGLIERQDQLDAMLVAVRDAAAGSGRVVLVTGEAGIGKSSLVRALLDRLGPDVLVLQGACDDLLAPRPLGPLQDAVRGRPGPLAEALRSAGSTDAVFGAVVAQLSAPATTVLVIEDVHWADDATVDVLRYLARRIDAVPAVLLLTVRDDAVVAHPTRQLLGALTGPAVVRLRLGPLSGEAVTALARSASRDGALLHAMTGATRST